MISIQIIILLFVFPFFFGLETNQVCTSVSIFFHLQPLFCITCLCVDLELLEIFHEHRSFLICKFFAGQFQFCFWFSYLVMINSDIYHHLARPEFYNMDEMVLFKLKLNQPTKKNKFTLKFIITKPDQIIDSLIVIKKLNYAGTKIESRLKTWIETQLFIPFVIKKTEDNKACIFRFVSDRLFGPVWWCRAEPFSSRNWESGILGREIKKRRKFRSPLHCFRRLLSGASLFLSPLLFVISCC